MRWDELPVSRKADLLFVDIKNKVFEINVAEAVHDELTNTSTLSSDNIRAGESITVYASAQGGTAPYQYTVLYKLSTRSKWTTAQAYSDNDTIIITPADSGQYDLCIKVKDATGKEEKLFPTITVAGGLVNTSKVPETVSLADTMRRADKIMYENKRIQKNSRST